RIDVGSRIGKMGVVEGIVGFRPELQRVPFGPRHLETLGERHIEIYKGRTAPPALIRNQFGASLGGPYPSTLPCSNVVKEILGSSPKLPTPVGSQPWPWRKYWKDDASQYLRSR